MADLAAGGEVIFTSCNDENHPGSNIIDGNDRTFWITTGLFPQQFIVQLKEEGSFSRLKTVTTNVRKLCFEKCTEDQPTAFEQIFEAELDSPQGSRIQQETHAVSLHTARFVRVTIVSGWDDFASVHRLGIEP
mmetsp:Transcript_28681/g.71041  ORF Transcript_28681/g.71041 Transcript_28681/m.71041 type:complete len:133 (+) Transcript_28681:148-546(+)